MNAKQTNKDKIYVFMTVFACSRVSSAVAMYASVLKCYYSNFFRFGNTRFFQLLIINYTLI